MLDQSDGPIESGGDPEDAANALRWLVDVETASSCPGGLIRVVGYDRSGRPADEVAVMERADEYGAYAVFFEAAPNGQNGNAQALVFIGVGAEDDLAFAELHKRLWSWGGVPLVYRRTSGTVQMFRCSHGPDFAKAGKMVCRPFDTLRIGAQINDIQAWWRFEQIRNGTLWDDPATAECLLSEDGAAHQRLVVAVRTLHQSLQTSGLLGPGLRRRLLILSLLIAYLDQRGGLPARFFDGFVPGATRLAQVLRDGKALVAMLADLKRLFNGDVFSLTRRERREILGTADLDHFAVLVDARQDESGQMNLWSLYSFRDLPVEVVSHVYELFVDDPKVSVYTPPALVRLIIDEVLDDGRLDRVIDDGEIVVDPACGSGIFLVEAFKKVVLRWRQRHDWSRPDVETLRRLLGRIHGIDIERGAIELATFSLCLAMCDAMTPETIRATPELFPRLRHRSLIRGDFFVKAKKLRYERVCAVVGNPPFKSKLETKGALSAWQRYVKSDGALPDRQVAYLFLHESMRLLTEGGAVGMVQQYNFLYNERPDFRRAFFRRWNVREVLDFVSVRNLFSKDTKALVVIATSETPTSDGSTLHAVFRRSARADASLHFDVDHYDMHWIPRRTILDDVTPDPWRANLLGGPRTYAFVKRLRTMPTLRAHALSMGWKFGEGFIDGAAGKARPAEHLYDQPVLPSEALTRRGIDLDRIGRVERKPIEAPRTAALFTPPMLLIREHVDLPCAVWNDGYLTFRNKIVGFAANEVRELEPVERWLKCGSTSLRAYAAAISVRALTQKATTLSCRDIYELPFDPNEEELELSRNESIVAADIVDYLLDYVRLGHTSALAQSNGVDALDRYSAAFLDQVNAFYPRNRLRRAGHAQIGGLLCLGFVFGEGEVDWCGGEALKARLDALLVEHRNASLSVTRIARIYDDRFVFLLKPDRFRFWLPSVALRDGDDVLADLRDHGI